MNTFDAQEEAAQTVKTDPILSYQRRFLIITAIIIVSLILIFVLLLLGFPWVINLWPGFYNTYRLIVGGYIPLFGIACGMPFFLIGPLRQRGYWKRHEERRQAAAREDQSLLALEQPLPDANALSLPFTIRQRTSRYLFLTILITGIVIVGVSILGAVFSLGLHRAEFITLGILGACICCLSWTFYAIGRQQTTITQDGLIVLGVFPKVHHIAWQDARLFAIYGLAGVQKDQPPVVFELSGADKIIRWTWLRSSNKKVTYFAAPADKQEEYDRQMQALLSVVAARTGLSLYDLREGPQGRTK